MLGRHLPLGGAALCSIAVVCALAASSGRARSDDTDDAQDSGTPCAGVPSTCNADQSECCNWWAIDVDSGGSHGTILEESYDDLMKSLESHRRTDDELCHYWQTASDCDVSYGAPRCSGTTAGAVAATSGQFAKPVHELIKAAEKKAKELSGFKDELKRFAKATAIDIVSPAKSAKPAAADARGPGPGTVPLTSLSGRDKVKYTMKALDEYRGLLVDAAKRAGDLGENLSDCVSEHNPFLDLPAEEPDDARPWINTGFGYGLSPFAPPSEQGAQQRTQDDGRAELQGLLDHAPSLPSITSLDLSGPAEVVGSHASGGGRILFGELGTLKRGDKLDGGSIPTLMLGANGYAPTTVTRRDDGPGERIIITASDHGSSDTVELLSCSARSHRAGNACACDRGFRWDGSSCACPDGTNDDGSSCVKCEPGARWDGHACSCPADTHHMRGACRVCSEGTTWNGTSCVDDPGCTIWYTRGWIYSEISNKGVDCSKGPCSKIVNLDDPTAYCYLPHNTGTEGAAFDSCLGAGIAATTLSSDREQTNAEIDRFVAACCSQLQGTINGGRAGGRVPNCPEPEDSP